VSARNRRVKTDLPATAREWWFGSVPSSWAALPLKYLCLRSSLYGANVPAEAYEPSGVRFLRTTDIRDDGSLEPDGVYLPRSLVADYLLGEGDFLISRSGTLGRGFVYRNEYGPCSYAGYLVRYILRERDCVRWLFYITKSTAFQVWLMASTIEATIGNVNGEKYANVTLPVPTLAERVAIAEYLDRETIRIDALIAAKQRQLDLIAEKRKAIIALALTRGIDPDAPMRDSGVPWLGKVPAHWEIERARWLFRERDVRSKTGEEEMLTVSHLTGVTPRSEKDVNMFEAETNEGYKVCLSGDLVINTLWAWMGAMGVAPMTGIVSPAYNVYETGPRLEPSYVDLLVRLPVFAQEVTRYSKGVWSSRLRLYPEGFFETYFPVPPSKDQKGVIEHITRETAKLDNVRRATERTIELLKERRSALITAVVTGQVDVGTAA
jgi:type I restriction enzyme, S subunit